MLKERIGLLSKRKQISRKDLVEGLVTQAHFANILADRYRSLRTWPKPSPGVLGFHHPIL